MFRIIACLASDHDYRIVQLAATICMITAFVSFRLYSYALESDDSKSRLLLVLTGSTTAVGIWATHFVAMLAYNTGIQMAYDVWLTIWSLVLAAVMTVAGFAIAPCGLHWPTIAEQLHFAMPTWLSDRFASWPSLSNGVQVSASLLRKIWARTRASAPCRQAVAQLSNTKLFQRVRTHVESMTRSFPNQSVLLTKIQAQVRTVPVSAAIGGAVVGAGIGIMHFTGMLSLKVAGTIEWDRTLVLASIVLGMTLASAAMVAFHQLDRPRGLWVAPGLFVLAVCGLHFTAMGAVTIIPDPTVVVPEVQITRAILALLVAGVTVLAIITCVVTLVIEKLSADLRARTQEAFAATKRFELALSQSKMAVFHHDMLHRCIWSYNCMLSASSILGKTDSQIMPPPVADVLSALKRLALKETGIQEGEICIETDHGELWSLVKVVQRTDIHGQVIGTTSVSLDITERKQWEKHLFMLMREVDHRSKNLLAVLSSISHCTAARATSIDDFSRKFSDRLQTLVRSHEVVAKDNWTVSSWQSLIDAQLSAHKRDCGDRVSVRGPEILLKPRAMQNLGLALHELATNSVKYGSLSAVDGRVELYWRTRNRGGENILQVAWREVGGPEVRSPKSKGFGSMLLERVVAAELNGKSRVKYRRSGVVWLAEIGAAHFVMPGAEHCENSDNPFSREARLREQYDQYIVRSQLNAA